MKRARGVRPGRINDREPVPSVSEIRCPAGLPAAAKKHWRDLARDLKAKGVLTIWDQKALATLCVRLAIRDRITNALFALDEEGTYKEPLVVQGERGAVRNQLLLELRQTEAVLWPAFREFGLTPSSRSTIKVDVPRKAPNVLQPVRDRTRPGGGRPSIS